MMTLNLVLAAFQVTAFAAVGSTDGGTTNSPSPDITWNNEFYIGTMYQSSA